MKKGKKKKGKKENGLKGQKNVQFEEGLRVHEIMRLPHLSGRRGLAIDGGAHVGSWTILLSEYFYKVHAFEPCSESYQMLVENMADRSCNAGLVAVHNKALMDKACKVDVKAPRPKKKVLTARQVTYGTEVDGIAIDDMNLECCDLIKLDLEGAEPLAIAGALSTIIRFKPFLVIEFNARIPDRFDITVSDMEETLKDLGYEEVWRNDVDRGFSCKRP